MNTFTVYAHLIVYWNFSDLHLYTTNNLATHTKKIWLFPIIDIKTQKIVSDSEYSIYYAT